jgi:hypothetical protein
MSDKERKRRDMEAAESDQPQAEREESPVRDLDEEEYSGMRQRVFRVFELPEDFRSHMRAARREFLLAIRSLIDARIEGLEEDEKRREVGRRSRVHID